MRAAHAKMLDENLHAATVAKELGHSRAWFIKQCQKLSLPMRTHKERHAVRTNRGLVHDEDAIETLREMLLAGRTHAEIAAALSCSRRTIVRLRAQHNLSGSHWKIDPAWFEAGMSVTAIAKKAGILWDTANEAKKRYLARDE